MTTVNNHSVWLDVYTHTMSVPANVNPAISGQVRWNFTMSCLEVCDGSSWMPVGQTVIEVSDRANLNQVLMWAEDKMHEEIKLKDLIGKHPGLKDAHEKFELMKALCLEGEKHGTD